MSKIAEIKSHLFTKTAKQTVGLFSAQIIGLIIGFAANIVLAKQMEPKGFGIYSFALSVVMFLSLFFEFGYFASTARLLVQTENKEEEKKLIGSSMILAGIIAILFSFIIYCISLFIDNIFEDKIGNILRLLAILSSGFVLPFYVELILKGTNQIGYLSLFQLIWKFLFVLAIIIFWYLRILSALNVLYAYSISIIISFMIFAIRIGPNFDTTREYIKEILAENKRYGIYHYMGRIVDVSAYQLNRLLIGYFVDATNVGFYSLANAMANPINMFSLSLSSSKFKSFANKKPISRKVLLTNFVWIFIAVVGADISGYLIVHFYLGEKYNTVVKLLMLMTLAIGFQAAYQPYNHWLGSNGFGKYLRKKALITATVNIALNITLIPLWGAIGAVIAYIISMAVSFSLHLYYYRLGLKQ